MAELHAHATLPSRKRLQEPLLQPHANAVWISTFDIVCIKVMNGHDTFEHPFRTALFHSNHTESRSAPSRGMRVTTERVRTTKGDKDAISGRRPIGEIWSQSRRSAF